MTLTFFINPGGVGCKYRRKGCSNDFAAVKILAKVEHRSRKWVMVCGYKPTDTPFALTVGELNRAYDPVPTLAPVDKKIALRRK